MATQRATATTRHVLRARNQNAVLQIVHRYGPISRSEIVSRLELSPAAVTSLTGDLIERGLIFEARQAEAGGVGRRAILLEVDYDRARVIGMKISSVGLTCALTDLKADVLHLESLPLADRDVNTVVDAVADAFSTLSERARRPVTALGLNLPGIVDADQRTVRFSPLLGWKEVALGDALERRLGVPVLVENDANALALAEAWFGHGHEHDDFLVVTLGRGVGLGIIVDGEIYRGRDGGAGEFGHLSLDPRGPRTEHAEPGTLEAYVSDRALLREARARIPSFPEEGTIDLLLAAARDGNPEAQGIYEEAGNVLGRALSMLVNIFAPSLIVLSGEGMRAEEFLRPAAERTLRRYAFGDLAKHLRLDIGSWGEDAWARGAAGLAATRYLVAAASRTGGDRAIPDRP